MDWDESGKIPFGKRNGKHKIARAGREDARGGAGLGLTSCWLVGTITEAQIKMSLPPEGHRGGLVKEENRVGGGDRHVALGKGEGLCGEDPSTFRETTCKEKKGGWGRSGLYLAFIEELPSALRHYLGEILENRMGKMGPTA